MDKGINKHYLLLHTIVFIWGFSPVLGRFITADAWQLVWYRILITVIAMFLWLKYRKISLQTSPKNIMKLGGIGLIILVHWIAFYMAIKVSNISVTMVAFSTGTLFSSIIEPILYKRKIRLYEIIIGFIIIAAILMIFSIETEYWFGIVLGIFAALTSSIFGVLNGLMIKDIRSGVISFYELLTAFLGLSIFLLIGGNLDYSFLVLDSQSVIGILLLSLVCTVFPFLAAVDLAKHISPYTIVLTVNLETVYGIIWAILFFSENKEVKPSFYIGVFIILIAIFLNSYLKKKSEKRILKSIEEK
ncbi:MAG: DMT family transporter [Sphingobacteriaceae bacterium]|nr:DMT family transporter [Sphingobacteriaceae bacterium]